VGQAWGRLVFTALFDTISCGVGFQCNRNTSFIGIKLKRRSITGVPNTGGGGGLRIEAGLRIRDRPARSSPQGAGSDDLTNSSVSHQISLEISLGVYEGHL